MFYFALTIAVFLLDFFVKRYVEKTYELKERHKILGEKAEIQKFYNQGAVLCILEKRPHMMKKIHSIVIILAAAVFYFCMKLKGKPLTKTGFALLMGGGLNNLYDRYIKGYVVDYVRFGFGPKWFRNIIFNVSDFFIFLGVVLAVCGGGNN